MPPAPELTLRKIDYLWPSTPAATAQPPSRATSWSTSWVLTNVGDGDATEVRLEDATPDGTSYVFGSLVVDPEFVVLDQDPLILTLDVLEAGESTTVLFRVAVDEFDGVSAIEIANQAWVESAETDLQASDDPAVPGPADPTVTTVSPTAPGEPLEIPTLGVLASWLFGLLLLGLGFGRTRRRQGWTR